MRPNKQMTERQWGENNCDAEMSSSHEHSQFRCQTISVFKIAYFSLSILKENNEFKNCMNKSWVAFDNYLNLDL